MASLEKRPMNRSATNLALRLALLLSPLAPSVLPAGDVAVDLPALRAHAEFLAYDSLRGRDSGSPEYAIAAGYAATRFASWGLLPGNGESFYQPVHFAEAKVLKSTFA